MDKPRGNAIDEPFVEELVLAGAELAADHGIRGVMLASAHPKLFCPGLDLVTLFEYDRPAMERFMTRFVDAMLGLFCLRRPVVAAIAGHAVAGGCVLALTADHRVLRGGGVQIGLAEVKVGLPLPWSVAVLVQSSLTPEALSRVALLGRNFADEEAVRIGLVHELANGDDFEAACLSRLEEFAEKIAMAFGITKAYLRSEALARMKAHEAERASDFLDAWFSEASRERIRQTIESLGKK
jgi:enoyl-CoA hydratase